ncbi:hypothetical protein F8M41_010156 [Gigaspora margarita]|uniref:Uncharacterized protein n=1 Tax=Gigaspora margarita TaxID=4874 RepID=A0A8H4A179_GIGMA|nr:hypothetical protein F8M41_010156 [Gigaspora margarita]
MPNLRELILEVLIQEMTLSIIENCPNIIHLTFKIYCSFPHDRIFKDLIQKLHLTHLTVKFLYSNSIISESSILSKEFLPLLLEYLVLHCEPITIYLDSLMEDCCYTKLKKLIINVMKFYNSTNNSQFYDITDKDLCHLLIIIPNFTFSAIPFTFYCTHFVPSMVFFNTSIANVALNISALQGPCVEITSTGEYTNRSSFAITQITSAEPLCYSDVAGVQDTRGSSVWFMSTKGWVWFGLTTNPNWNLSC